MLVLISCSSGNTKRPTQEMINILESIDKSEDNPDNTFAPEASLRFYDSLLKTSPAPADVMKFKYRKANALLELGQEQKAIDVFQDMLNATPASETGQRTFIMKELAMAYLRLGERMNCVHNHSAESCIFPISTAGVHQDKTGSQKAIELYKQLLADNPDDLESRWLLNIAYMTTGGYPQQVPAALLLKVGQEDTVNAVKPFTDVAANVGLNINNQAGGSIVDDFNNDGYDDIITSSWSLKEPMHYCRNNGNGTFTDISDSSWLGHLTGGLNIMQTDYNNDGFKDIFVLRGAWKESFGNEPNSLLRNNGDGTFTDVTKASGLFSIHPTQAATWADFNNDGWLDVFIGNESIQGAEQRNISELYINNKNGTFTEQAALADCNIRDFVKGVTSGDYDNDGKMDIFISTMNGQKYLFKNQTEKGGPVKFKEVTRQAGLSDLTRTFPCWFFDYDNDGWLDILVCGYEFTKSLAYYAGAEAVQSKNVQGNSGKVMLYRNKHDGTFEDVSVATGLKSIAFAMGSNFGDIDNDGYLDFYLGTGNPSFKSLVPNKLFRNIQGTKFADVTTSARVGNLQKGHGVSFADLDNDGDQDIYIEMGGAYSGDAYENSLYLNPGQNNNHWIKISLEGTQSNRAAIGAKIKVTFKENNKERFVYREVNSGGSFGSNPLRQHIGIGQASLIDKIEIQWPVTNQTQVFKNVPGGLNIKIKEGATNFTTYKLASFNFEKINTGIIECRPIP
jgi:hypothetical protein